MLIYIFVSQQVIDSVAEVAVVALKNVSRVRGFFIVSWDVFSVPFLPVFWTSYDAKENL